MLKSFSVLTRRVFLLIVPCTYILFPLKQDSTASGIQLDKNYPKWLKNNSYHTNQTSGITFLREKEDGTIEFLLADDIGKIHRLFIKGDTTITFSPIIFNKDVKDYLNDFPKLDFEEILYDKFANKVYITIEGNGDNHLLYHGIFKLEFKDNDISQDSIVGIEKLNLMPKESFIRELKPNIGYEGLAVDEKYFYLGLESVMSPEGKFSGYTIISIVDKKTFTIIKDINTRDLEITTVCGLYSDENYSLWGIDRNERKIFKLKLDEYFNVVEKSIYDINTVIPNYNQFEYTGSLESITISKDGYFFLVDDPWHTFFVPPNEILNQLDEVTKNNFKEYIPIIYKFVIK